MPEEPCPLALVDAVLSACVDDIQKHLTPSISDALRALRCDDTLSVKEEMHLVKQWVLAQPVVHCFLWMDRSIPFDQLCRRPHLITCFSSALQLDYDRATICRLVARAARLSEKEVGTILGTRGVADFVKQLSNRDDRRRKK